MLKLSGDFQAALLATFAAEAQEHVQALVSGLLALEKSTDSDRPAVMETLLRGAHTLKGAARAVDKRDIETLCQSMESVLSDFKKSGSALSSAQLDDLHHQVDVVQKLLGPGPALSGDATIRLTTGKLDSLLLQAEEMLAVKMAAQQEESEVRAIGALVAAWKKQGMSDADSPERWNELESRLAALARAAEHHRVTVSTKVDNLLEDAKQMRIQPFSTLFEPFPKVVRDLSHAQEKEVELVLSGQQIEIDRRILEGLKDPLMHLVRNAIDHGVECPAVRVQTHKASRATLRLTASPADGNTVEVVVSDDGAGIPLDDVKAAAVQQRIISAEDAARLDEAGALELIFQSHVSTRQEVTEISGRGLGLAIVREKVEKLGGRITVSTSPAGTVFRIQVPLTLATLRGVLIRAAGHLFAVPTSDVQRLLRVTPDQIKKVGDQDSLFWDGRLVPLVRLGDVFGLPVPAEAATNHPIVMILSSRDQRRAFIIDDVLHEQEILMKSFGAPLRQLRYYMGATVLASGKSIPILHAADLLTAPVQRADVSAPTASALERRSILLVEDSITSRMFLKNILESAGYRVQTAVDGMDGWTQLRSGDYDLIVSDIDMPRLDGFDLTSRVRQDPRFGETPVILVSSRESREDRERGVDAGASAYVLKSHFDQGYLLDTVKRFI